MKNKWQKVFIIVFSIAILVSYFFMKASAKDKKYLSEDCSIFGSQINDVLIGTDGKDFICGLGGDDLIIGKGGNDILIGGGGKDTLFGSTGRDLCEIEDGESFNIDCEGLQNPNRLNECNLTSDAVLLITPEMIKKVSDQYMNGPSVIRVPEWIQNPLGKYYMYFADHRGQYIRFAYANVINGPWKIYEGGVLDLAQAAPLTEHIASPDIYIDNLEKKIYLTAHGKLFKSRDQGTVLFESKNGINFQQDESYSGKLLLDEPYIRIISLNNSFFAFVRDENKENKIKVFRSDKINKNFILIKEIDLEVEIRHLSVNLKGDVIEVFYSGLYQTPERIMKFDILVDKFPDNLTIGKSQCVRAPTENWEGSQFRLIPSKKSYGNKSNELRDPFIFNDSGKNYLFYSVAGESGIAVAEVK